MFTIKVNLIIYGSGEHGKVVWATAKEYSQFKILGFIDDSIERGTDIFDTKVLGDFLTLSEGKIKTDFKVCFGIGHPAEREVLFDKLTELGCQFQSIIDKSASVFWNYTLIGVGSYIAAKSVVHINVELGNACVLDNGAIVSHDCKIGDFSEISVGAMLGGGVTVGSASYIGMGAVIRDHVVIGNNVVVGAGAVVTKDVPDNTMFYGVPARKIKDI